MKNPHSYLYFIILLNIIRITLLFTTVVAYTSYGAYNNIPWLNQNKPSYYVPSPWHPVPGPYGHSDYTTSLPYQHHFNEHPHGFSQQQIVHIHDANVPDTLRGDHYQEGNDYTIHNVISNIEIPEHDLEGVASSKIETRNQKPKEKPKQNNSRRRNSNENKKPTKSKSKRHNNQNPKTNRRRPENNQSKAHSRVSTRNYVQRRPSHASYRRQQELRRRASQNRRIRPTRKAVSRIPFYDYDDYIEYFENKRRRNEQYDNDYYNDHRKSEFERQEAGESEEVEEEETTTAETTSTETTTLETTSTPTTETTETTTLTTETTTMTSTYGYGPSNGNENISITYPPYVNMRFDYETPFSNFWYYQHGIPDNFYSPNYSPIKSLVNK